MCLWAGKMLGFEPNLPNRFRRFVHVPLIEEMQSQAAHVSMRARPFELAWIKTTYLHTHT